MWEWRAVQWAHGPGALHLTQMPLLLLAVVQPLHLSPTWFGQPFHTWETFNASEHKYSPSPPPHHVFFQPEFHKGLDASFTVTLPLFPEGLVYSSINAMPRGCWTNRPWVSQWQPTTIVCLKYEWWEGQEENKKGGNLPEICSRK